MFISLDYLLMCCNCYGLQTYVLNGASGLVERKDRASPVYSAKEGSLRVKC
jgi:hypothetical protein